MVKEIEIFQIDAFTNVAFCGNPAGVTFSNNLSETEKQLIAKEMNLSETAFISSSDNADFKLQWFTPCLLYTSPSPRDRTRSRMPSSA